MKIKVTNTNEYSVVRLGVTFAPGSTTEVEVNDSYELITFKAPRGFVVEEVAGNDVEQEVQNVVEPAKRTTKAKEANNLKVEKTEAGE